MTPNHGMGCRAALFGYYAVFVLLLMNGRLLLSGYAVYGNLAGRAVPYSVDPTKPMGSWKTAWKATRKLAGAILKGDPDDTGAKALSCRIHDLRHTAISRMINAGIPLPKVAKIVGWSPSSMVKMAARYGHFTSDDLREAMETISTGSPVFSPVHTDKAGAKLQ